MSTNSNIQIRPASVNDQDFILSLVPRLVEFGPPTWRDVPHMIATDIQVLSEKLMNQSADVAFFIAEDKKGALLGFIHLEAGKDYYHHEKHGHIANVIVAPEGEGQGV